MLLSRGGYELVAAAATTGADTRHGTSGYDVVKRKPAHISRANRNKLYSIAIETIAPSRGYAQWACSGGFHTDGGNGATTVSRSPQVVTGEIVIQSADRLILHIQQGEVCRTWPTKRSPVLV
jgi:hypothetical protein